MKRKRTVASSPKATRRLTRRVANDIHNIVESIVHAILNQGLRGDDARARLAVYVRRDVHCDDHKRSRFSITPGCPNCARWLAEGERFGSLFLPEAARMADLVAELRRYLTDSYPGQDTSLEGAKVGFDSVDGVRLLRAALARSDSGSSRLVAYVDRELMRHVEGGWFLVGENPTGLFVAAVDADTALAVSLMRQRLVPGEYVAVGPNGEPKNRRWSQHDADLELLDRALARHPAAHAAPSLTLPSWGKYETVDRLDGLREEVAGGRHDESIGAFDAAAAANLASIDEALGWHIEGRRVRGHRRADGRWCFVGLTAEEDAAYRRVWSAVLAGQVRVGSARRAGNLASSSLDDGPCE